MTALRSPYFWRGFRRGLIQGGAAGSALFLMMICTNLEPLKAFALVSCIVVITIGAYEQGRR